MKSIKVDISIDNMFTILNKEIGKPLVDMIYVVLYAMHLFLLDSSLLNMKMYNPFILKKTLHYHVCQSMYNTFIIEYARICYSFWNLHHFVWEMYNTLIGYV
jgi:hypothetical protein